MSLPKFSVNQSLFINLVSAMLIIIGLLVMFGMNREVFPNVSFDMVSINTVYPGATPIDIEKLITVPIEKELKEVDGIDEISSSSALGASYITVEIDPDEGDKKKVVNDIKDAVDRVKDLPRDIYEDPITTEIDSKQYAIIEVSLSGNMDESKLRYYADALEDMLEDISGVAKATKSGYRDREVQIHLDPDKLRDLYVSFDEIEEALATRNVSIPAGEFNTEVTEYSVRTTGEFTTVSEVEDIIIRANDAGHWLRIKDIAVVKDSFKKEDIIYKTFGDRSINLLITKKESGDALSIVDTIKIKCDEFLKNCPDSLKISYVNDYSYFARRRLNVLGNNGWISFLIVIAIMMLFLQYRVAIVTIMGIPIAFLATFIIMSAMGITINLMSMFGLIIVLGMLVDDGIIVAENAYRYMEKGFSPREAAIKGTEDVMGAVVAAVFTTIAAFSPLLFMTGIIGKFIRNIPTVLIIALIASLGEALIILPSHLSDFVKVKIGTDGKPQGLKKEMPWFKKLVSAYTKIVETAVKKKWYVFTGTLIAAIISIAVIVLSFSGKGPLKFVLFPSAGINYFFIRAEAPIGTPLSRTNELIAPVEEIVAKIPAEEMDAFVTSVGNISEDRHDPFSGKASHLVQIAIYLKPEQDRKRSADQIIAELREKTKDVKGFTDFRLDKPEAGPPVGKPVEVKARGEDFDTLDEIAFEYMDYLKTIDGTTDVTWDHKPGKEEIRIKVDHDKAKTAGLSIVQIAKTIRGVFEGIIATKIKPVRAEEETDVTIMFSKEVSNKDDVFDSIFIQNKYGNLIPLKKVASIEKVPGTTTIHHLDGKRVVTASSNLDTDKITSVKINKMLQEKFAGLKDKYFGYSIKYGGEQEESMKSLASLLKAFFYAFLVIYLILASFFRSLVQPFIVMLAIPFGIIGVVIAFIAHGVPMSFLAILGIIGLNGIVVNDSIVLVSFINKLRREGSSRYDSIIRAGQIRLRPVILTTVTTAGGLSTVAYGIGGKDPFLVPMALSICWGIIFATLLTLIVIPCVYSIVDDIAIKLTHHSSMIRCEKNGTCDNTHPSS
ncbi:MAG: efflux RND transporter permease subunit [Candidatus Orphnella occulta]|nr:efflux RND transporter permease subunit [Candidatus Orphnella occulta]